MSTTIKESEMDVDEIRQEMHPGDVEEALGIANELMKVLWPLKRGYAEGTSPAVLRAVFLVQQTLEEALEGPEEEECDPTQELKPTDTTELRKSIKRLEDML